jgi:hypothetical protein
MSEYEPKQYAICMGGMKQAKNAALYFDRIIPIMFGTCPHNILLPALFEDQEVQNAIGMIDLVAKQHLPKSTNVGAMPINHMLVQMAGKDGKPSMAIPRHAELSISEQNRIDSIIAYEYAHSESEYRKVTSHFFGSNKVLKDLPIVLPGDCVAEGPKSIDDISIVLSGIPIADVSNVPWEQITDFRSDADAKKKLRKLRVFMYDSFSGKSKSYIEDKISIMIEEYQSASEKHGFELVNGTLTTLANSKTLIGTVGAVFAAAVLGEPITATVAALTGASIEVSKLALHVSNKQYAFNQLAKDHPLAYLVEANKLG